MAESFTSTDFHNAAHKQMLNIVSEAMARSTLAWKDVEPLIEAARRLCRSDFEETSLMTVHAVRAENEEWVEAEEAYLALSVADGATGTEWLAQTWWLSDLVTTQTDVEQARLKLAALERSIARIRSWIEAQEAPGKITEPSS